MMEQLGPDAWVEVNLSALRHNFREVQTLVGDTKVLAVVKADAYGHGAVETAKAFVSAGAHMLGVTRLAEAMDLRNAGVHAPILILAPIQAENVETAILAGLECCIDSVPMVEAFSKSAFRLKTDARVQIKIDSGMGRLGVLPTQAIGLVERVSKTPGLRLKGLYTHFARSSEKDPRRTTMQLQQFTDLIQILKHMKLDYGITHAANSGALIRFPESRLEMVRPGTILYGQYPSKEVPAVLNLRSTWSYKARVCDIRDLPRGAAVGYGGDFVTDRKSRIAILPVGFSDGVTIAPEGPIYRQSILHFAARKRLRRPTVFIRGAHSPIAGRVSMQLTAIDVTENPGVTIGDVAIIPALRLTVGSHIPRVYIEGQDTS